MVCWMVGIDTLSFLAVAIACSRTSCISARIADGRVENEREDR